MHSLTFAPPNHDDAFYIAGKLTELMDAATWDRVAAQFLAEREMESRWPGFEDQTLVEFDIERCLLTLTLARDGLPAGHTVWHAQDAR